ADCRTRSAVGAPGPRRCSRPRRYAERSPAVRRRSAPGRRTPAAFRGAVPWPASHGCSCTTSLWVRAPVPEGALCYLSRTFLRGDPAWGGALAAAVSFLFIRAVVHAAASA